MITVKVVHHFAEFPLKLMKGLEIPFSQHCAERFVRPHLVVQRRIVDTEKALMQLPSLYRCDRSEFAGA
jgi:hypothetical protein